MTGAGVGAQSPDFSYRLGFDRPAAEGLPSRPDGQLANMVWGAGSSLDKGYNYSYDRHGQLTAAILTENTGGTWTESSSRAEQGMRYDKNGNILSVERTDEQGQPMQSLAYNYEGNLLRSVDVAGATDDAQEFTYDKEGNMTFDGMSGIGIEYNILNLP
jgi:YD repeat-containing protein